MATNWYNGYGGKKDWTDSAANTPAPCVAWPNWPSNPQNEPGIRNVD